MSKTLKKRDATQSKQLILDNAKKLFAKQGFNASSMDELGKMCGLNKAMIFYYYKNKQGLFEAVMIDILNMIDKAIEHKLQQYSKPIERLESFIKTYGLFACKHPYFPALLLKELSSSGAVLNEQLFSHMQNLYSKFSQILKDGEDEGYFKDVKPMVLYFMIIGTLNLMVTTKNLRKTVSKTTTLDTCANSNIEEIIEYLINKLKRGIYEN